MALARRRDLGSARPTSPFYAFKNYGVGCTGSRDQSDRTFQARRTGGKLGARPRPDSRRGVSQGLRQGAKLLCPVLWRETTGRKFVADAVGRIFAGDGSARGGYGKGHSEASGAGWFGGEISHGSGNRWLTAGRRSLYRLLVLARRQSCVARTT